MKYQLILLFLASVLFSVEGSGSNVDGDLKSERIARHNEIRLELEREATPFLMDTFNTQILGLGSLGSEIDPKPVVTSALGVFDYLGELSVIDLVAGLFSILSLAIGFVYIIWKKNPFLGKNIK